MYYCAYSYCILLLITRCLAEDFTFPPLPGNLTLPPYFFKPLSEWPDFSRNFSDPYKLLKKFNLPDYRNPKTLEDFLRFHYVAPHMMEFSANETLQVVYEDFKVKTGWAFAPTLMTKTPCLQWSADPNSLYLLIFTDPDYPSTTITHCGELMHWFVANIPGLLVDKGDTYMEYLGPIPPKCSGLHRYVFQIYKQSGPITFSIPRVNRRQIQHRRCFRSMEFSKKHKLGNPVASNIFLAEYDGYGLPLTVMQGNHLFGPDDKKDDVLW